MAKGVKVTFHKAGFAAVLKSDGVRDDIEARAKAVAAEAGEGFEASVEVGKSRVRGSVITATSDARVAEAVDHTLTRAIDAAR